MVEYSTTAYKGFNIISSGKDEFPYNIYYNDGIDETGTWVDVESSIDNCKKNIDRGIYSKYVIKVKSLLKQGKMVPRYINNLTERWTLVRSRAEKVCDEEGNVINYIYRDEDVPIVEYLKEMDDKVDRDEFGWMMYETYYLGKIYSTIQSFCTDAQKKIYGNFVKTFNLNSDISINNVTENIIRNILFKRHCLGKNTTKVSSTDKVYYDFETPEEYLEFIENIKLKLAKPDITINSFNRAKYIYDILDPWEMMQKGVHSILFTEKCHLYNENNELESIALLMPDSDYASNFPEDFIVNVVVMNSKKEIAFVYPVSFGKVLKITSEVTF